MLKIIAAALAASLALTQGAAAASMSGAGATFPAPVYAKWAETYKAKTGNALNYQPIGSGGGIKQIEASTVDFGASDKPLKPQDLEANGLVQFPTVIGGVVPVVNLPGFQPGQIKLTGKVLAGIYLGLITRWNDPVIASWNPGLRLPNTKITVVHRSDGSGTSFLFTSYLAGQEPKWAEGPGASDSVNWPTGQGGKGNDGVAAFVKQTVGSVGYVEYAYAKQNHLTHLAMRNKVGNFVEPDAAAFAAAAAGASWSKAPGLYLLLLDQPGKLAWPITGATFILMHTKQANPAAGKDVLTFFDWAYKNGNAEAAALDYVPLPETVKAFVRKTVWPKIDGADGKAVYP
ncbi:MAG TPA: phosphate ABC transporter substrate-binding protein PstS [Caulobacteraceae bacterium]|jgi:phosphate transport system substrate-binding protein|nr:phosphate ABC transporter substrate-binding protein PstS [Caulobacteraceae bacterium]